MFGISEYLMAGAVAVAVAGGGYGAIQKQNANLAYANLEAAKADLRIAKADLAVCGARLVNILEDKESDNAIDNLPDLRDFNVPDHWLLLAPADN